MANGSRTVLRMGGFMKNVDTEILVIGGGATGVGIARDLAMRGFKNILIEKGDYSHGTTGRYHGLLHSGARYVVKDPLAAIECYEENEILRRIIPNFIEDTGGFFVLTPWDDPVYADEFLQGCKKVKIPVEEISVTQMLKEEPYLNKNIIRCFRVPDGSADSFLSTEAIAESSKEYGTSVLTYHKVIGILFDQNRVSGVICEDQIKGELIRISADFVVNAGGAWAGQIASLANIKIIILPGKGTMLAINTRIVNTVINRCKKPSDGDIIVPAHTVSVIGTTDYKVENPDFYPIEKWEIKLLMDEGEKLIPDFKYLRVIRAWAGVRPLFTEDIETDNREISRSYVLLDHKKRDGVDGFLTITSGKWTTFRKMAQVTVDLVCTRIGVNRPCRTHLEPIQLEKKLSRSYATIGTRLEKIEKDKSYKHLVCECELVVEQDVIESLEKGQAKTIDDIRRDTRLGMGPCQGEFCTYRAVGIRHLYQMKNVEESNHELQEYYRERWKGVAPILWGKQLQQEKFNELVFRYLFNVEKLPGKIITNKFSSPYLPSVETFKTIPDHNITGSNISDKYISASRIRKQSDIVVIGSGLSGLVSAICTSHQGKKTKLITKGWGSLFWTSGCIDLISPNADINQDFMENPLDKYKQICLINREHPYSKIDLRQIEESFTFIQDICSSSGYPLLGSIKNNWFLPTSVGSYRPTCLIPETMVAGDLRNNCTTLVVGFQDYLDFFPKIISDNLQKYNLECSSLVISPSELSKRFTLNNLILAELFESQEFRDEVCHLIKTKISDGTIPRPKRIGFPAVLGIRNSSLVQHDLELKLGSDIFEIPTLPPSIPGIRLFNVLKKQLINSGGEIYEGMEVNGFESKNGEILSVISNSTSRILTHTANIFILATGGILGGGIFAEFETNPKEKVFNLPVSVLNLNPDYCNSEAFFDPLFTAGIRVNEFFQPVDYENNIIYHNVRVVGSSLFGSDYFFERSSEGVNLTTAWSVGESIG